MIIFIAIAVASFIILAGSFLFGHDHDVDHGGIEHDAAGGDIDHDAEPTIGFFSTKVLATLTMGFGAAGAIARQYGADYLGASLIGLATGLILSLVLYALLNLIYKQQASSLIHTSSAIGQLGVVETSIGAESAGEVSLNVNGQYMTFIAKSAAGMPIAKGRTVKVVNTVGSELLVEQVNQ